MVDLGEASDRRFAYEQILSNGAAGDVETLIHPAQLVADRDELFITAAVAEIWIPWFEAHDELCLRPMLNWPLSGSQASSKATPLVYAAERL